MPNGLAFSPDGSVLYVADTGGHRSHPDPDTHDMPRTVSAYALRPDGSLDPEPRWQTELGCDGMCVDTWGNIYTTSGPGVTVLSPDGEVLGTIEVPESPANCCFGGEDFQTLFITARTSLYFVRMRVAGHRPERS
jgi:gluconolactonase